jgi:hypothetical protein
MQFGFFYAVIIVRLLQFVVRAVETLHATSLHGMVNTTIYSWRRDVACNVSTLWGIPEKCCLRRDVACNVSTLWGMPEKCCLRRDVACNVSTLWGMPEKCCHRRDVACNVSTLWGLPEKCCLRRDVACNVSTLWGIPEKCCLRRDVACNVSTGNTVMIKSIRIDFHRNAWNDNYQSGKIPTTFTQPLPPYTNLHHTSRSTQPVILAQAQAWAGNYQILVCHRRGAWAQ